MATFALDLALFVLFSSLKAETNAQIITVHADLHNTVDIPCRCPILRESTAAVQWYRSSSSDVFRKYGKALASWPVGTTSSSQGIGITDDFSMVMYSVNLSDQGLYRCIVTPLVVAAECTHDVNLGIYANPDTSPVIEYIRETNGFIVTCSISYIFPMTFPILITKGRNGTVYINRNSTYNRDGTLNIDGTYNTTLTHWFPANEMDTIIECLYSNLNFKIMSSLYIVDNYITVEPKEGDRMQNNMTHTHFSSAPSGLWMVWIILILEVLFFIFIGYAIKTGRALFHPALLKTIWSNTDDKDRDEHHGEDSKEEDQAKSMRYLLCGKLNCAVITLIIQIIVLIFIVVYLATARR